MSQESIAMGYERLILLTVLICVFSIGSMGLIGRGQVYDDPYYFWSGILLFIGGVMGMFGYATYKFILEFNAGFIIHNIMYGGTTKPIQESLYFEDIQEITSAVEKEDLTKFIKPGEEYLLPMMNSPNFYYTRISHRGDRGDGNVPAETDYITVLPFTTAIQFFSWKGSWICEYYPRMNPRLSVTYGEYRGTRETISTKRLTRIQEIFERIGLRQYDTRYIQSVPVYFVLGCTATANYSNLIQKLPHLEAAWVEQNARGVQAQDSADRETEIDMLYDIIENDKRLLSRKMRPAFYETKMIEKEGIRGAVSGMSNFQRNALYLLFAGIFVWGVVTLLTNTSPPTDDIANAIQSELC